MKTYSFYVTDATIGLPDIEASNEKAARKKAAEILEHMNNYDGFTTERGWFRPQAKTANIALDSSWDS